MTQNKLIPLEKQSRKQRKAVFSARRASWGNVNPVTRVRETGKAYDRRRARREERERRDNEA